MTPRARALVRSWIPIVCLVAVAPPAIAGEPVEVPVFCDDFELADACDWTAVPSCAAVCGVSGSCNVDYCDCPPGTPFGFLEGHWSGTWEDTIYEVSGAVEATFSIVCGQVVAAGVIDLSDLGLGSQSGTGIGTVAGDTLSFTFEAAMVGGGSGTLTLAGAAGGAQIGASGTGSGSGSVTAPLSFGPFTFSGSVTATTITGTFDFTNPGGGEGDVSLAKD